MVSGSTDTVVCPACVYCVMRLDLYFHWVCVCACVSVCVCLCVRVYVLCVGTYVRELRVCGEKLEDTPTSLSMSWEQSI